MRINCISADDFSKLCYCVFLFGMVLSAVFAYTRGKPLRSLVDYLSSHAEDGYIEGDEYDYIRKYIMKLSNDSALTKEQLLDKMFAKLLFTGLNQKEKEVFSKLADWCFLNHAVY